MLRLILADAQLELVPADIAGHPAVRKQAEALGKKPTQILLDQNVHATASRPLKDGERRGRPDIVHLSLLTVLESPLNKLGKLMVCVHTLDGELLRLRSDVRLPRGEARFQGLLAKVLLEGKSQDKDPLVWSEGRRRPGEVLEAVGKGPVVRMDETGVPQTPAEVVALAGGSGDLTIVLGTFPSGDFSAAWKEAAPNGLSIFPQPLNAWAVAAELVSAFRAKWG